MCGGPVGGFGSNDVLFFYFFYLSIFLGKQAVQSKNPCFLLIFS
jgi:hypothetical protein